MSHAFVRSFTLLTVLVAVGTGCQHQRIKIGQMEETSGLGKQALQYRLNKCPLPDKILPESSAQDGWDVTAGYLPGPYCHGFTKYRLSKLKEEVEPIYARLDHAGHACTLDVVVPTPPSCVGKPLADCDPNRLVPSYADRFAHALTNQTQYSVTAPETGEMWKSDDDFAAWCRKEARRRAYAPKGGAQ